MKYINFFPVTKIHRTSLVSNMATGHTDAEFCAWQDITIRFYSFQLYTPVEYQVGYTFASRNISKIVLYAHESLSAHYCSTELLFLHW